MPIAEIATPLFVVKAQRALNLNFFSPRDVSRVLVEVFKERWVVGCPPYPLRDIPF